MNPRFKINDHFERVEQDLVDQLRQYPAANIGDVLNRVACISGQLKPLNTHRLCGRAYTVKTVPGDNLILYYAIDNAQPGDILVIDGGGYDRRALCGEIMISYAVKKKIGGIVVDGAIRDAEALRKMPIPIYTAHISPNGPYKNGPGEINVPVVIDGIVVNPGDVLVGDEDGIVVIKPDEVQDVLEAVEKVEEKETHILQKIHEQGILEMQWMYDVLDKNDITYEGGNKDGCHI